jgi:uncharacterized protein (TIGR00369 family)
MSQPTFIEEVMTALFSMGGLTNNLGFEWSLDHDEQVLFRVDLKPEHQGGPGVAHGGVISALLDTALGARTLTHVLPRGCATSTVELKVNYLRPAPIGETLVTSTEVQNAGRSLLVVTGDARIASSGKRVAFAVGTFNIYPSEAIAARLAEREAQARAAQGTSDGES